MGNSMQKSVKINLGNGFLPNLGAQKKGVFWYYFPRVVGHQLGMSHSTDYAFLKMFFFHFWEKMGGHHSVLKTQEFLPLIL